MLIKIASRKEYFWKYYSSNIFNSNPKSSLDEGRPKFLMNHSSLENDSWWWAGTRHHGVGKDYTYETPDNEGSIWILNFF